MSKNVTYDKEAELIHQSNADSGAFAVFDAQSVDQMFPEEVIEALHVIGVKDENRALDLKAMLQEYGTSYWVHDENGELDEHLDELKNARNIIGRTNLLYRVHKDGSFKLPEDPFENTCPKCHGMGELFLFNRVPKEVECNRCEGGKVWVRCRSCKGTGRYQIRFKEGGGINVECRTCKDSPADHKGQVQVKCRVCKGTTIAKIMVLDASLKSTTPCPVCDELGFILPEKKKRSKRIDPGPDNPVLAGDLAEKLKSQIDDNASFDNSIEDEDNRANEVDQPHQTAE
jgi:hypothetical protein